MAEIKGGMIVALGENPDKTFQMPKPNCKHRVLMQYDVGSSKDSWLLTNDISEVSYKIFMKHKSIGDAQGLLSVAYGKDLVPLDTNEDYLNLLPKMEEYR